MTPIAKRVFLDDSYQAGYDKGFGVSDPSDRPSTEGISPAIVEQGQREYRHGLHDGREDGGHYTLPEEEE